MVLDLIEIHMIAAEGFSALKERLKVHDFDGVAMKEDPFWQDVQIWNQFLETLKVLSQVTEEDVEIING